MLKLKNTAYLICIILFSAQSFGQNLFMPNSVKYKKMDNGFSYYLIPGSDRGKVAMYLVSNTGSLVESYQERGVGHFLEHMVFKGSKNYPGDQTTEIFEKMGLRVGRDYNASVDDLKTEYKVFIPEGNLSELHQILLLFKDWMFDLEMQQDAFKVEQKVVIEEIAKRSTVTSPLLNGTPLEGHNGLGTKEQINNITINQVRDFYKKNYTANQLSLVIQGKIDEKEVEKYIKSIFGPIKSTNNTNKQKYLDLSASTVINGNLKPFNEKDLPSLVLSFKTIANPVDNYTSLKQNLIQSLFCEMMENRLTQFPSQSISKSEVEKGSIVTGTMMFNFKIKSKSATSYQQMLTDFCYVIAQARKFGFSQNELDFFVKKIISRLKNGAEDDSVSLSDLKNHFLTGDIPLSGRQRFSISQQILKKLSLEDFKTLLNTFTSYHKTILFDQTSNAFATDFTNDYILNSLENIDSSNQKLTSYQFQEPKNVFQLQNNNSLAEVKIENKSAVKIKKKEILGDNLYVLKYANGIKVVVNKSPNADTQIKIIGKQGLNSIPKEDRASFKASTNLFDASFGSYTEKEASNLQRNLRIFSDVKVRNYDYELNLKGSENGFLQLIKIFNLIVTNDKVPNTTDFNKNLEIQLKKESKSKDEHQDFLNQINGLNLEIPEAAKNQFDEESVKRFVAYNQLFKRDLKNSYVYVGGALPENVDELISTYIANIQPITPQDSNEKAVETLNAPKPTVKDFYWNTNATKDNFMFSSKSNKPITFKDKLITNGIAEFAYKKLYEILRKKHGLIYALGTTGYTNKDQRLSSVSIRYMIQEAPNVSAARKAMIEEVLPAMSKAELSDNEINIIKALLEKDYVASFYDNERLGSEYLKWGLDYGKLYTIKEFQKMIREISAEEIKQQMKHLINLNEYYLISQKSK